MLRISISIVFVLAVLLTVPASGLAADRPAVDRIVVAFPESVTSQQQRELMSATGARSVLEIPALGALVVKPLPGTFDITLAQLRHSGLVKYAHPDEIVEAAGGTVSAASLQPAQYNLRVMRAPEAWRVNRGSSNVVVAIVDTGIDYTHPAFAGGRVINGRDFWHGDDDSADEPGHGTHVAGIVNGEDPSVGYSGVAPGVRTLSVKAMGGNTYGLQSTVAQAIIYSADRGAQIINMSLMTDEGAILDDALKYAISKGSRPVCAGGNRHEYHAWYPARYPGCLAVAATDERDFTASFSNWGPEIRISAPGDNIVSTFLDHRYGALNGTSMATAATSASLALLMSQGLSSQAAVEILLRTADDLGAPGPDEYFGAGRINLERAMLAAPDARIDAVTQPGRSPSCGTSSKRSCLYDRGAVIRFRIDRNRSVSEAVPLTLLVQRSDRGKWRTERRLATTVGATSTAVSLGTSLLSVGRWRVVVPVNGRLIRSHFELALAREIRRPKPSKPPKPRR